MEKSRFGPRVGAWGEIRMVYLPRDFSDHIAQANRDASDTVRGDSTLRKHDLCKHCVRGISKDRGQREHSAEVHNVLERGTIILMGSGRFEKHIPGFVIWPCDPRSPMHNDEPSV